MDIGVNPGPQEARAAVIDDLDSTLVGLLEQDVFRFQVAVNDAVVFLEFEGLQNLNGESSNEILGHALEVVVFYEFVEIDAKALKGDH